MLGCMHLSLDLGYFLIKFYKYILYAFSLYITCRGHCNLHIQHMRMVDAGEVKMKWVSIDFWEKKWNLEKKSVTIIMTNDILG